MRIAVCDDEKVFLQMICNKIDSFYKSLDVCCIAFGDGSEIIKAYECGQRFDAVFLDIEMKKLDGMKTAERIRSFSSEVPIIFLTSHTEFAMEGYEVGAMRFLQKPVKNDRLEQALTDIKNFYGSRCNLILKHNGSQYIVAAEDIIIAEADDNNVRFITCDREYRVRMKFTEALRMLNEAAPYFCRIHRGIIVNLGHVSRYNDKEVRTDNNITLPLSRSFASRFRSDIFEYVKHNAR